MHGTHQQHVELLFVITLEISLGFMRVVGHAAKRRAAGFFRLQHSSFTQPAANTRLP